MIEKKDIEELKKGNKAVQEKVYNYYAPKLKSLCLRYSKSNFEAEDIFQEAFYKIFTRIDKYSSDGSFEGWVKRIVVNTAIDYYKKNLNFNNVINIEETHNIESDGADIASEMSAEELLKVIQKLPEGYRMVFNMYEIEGFSHKEIAAALNISENTSKSQLFKAKKYIRSILEKCQCLTNGSKRK